jgi:hypothetical protein
MLPNHKIQAFFIFLSSENIQAGNKEENLVFTGIKFPEITQFIAGT